jgi:mono/diheme cytochrome c family protein
VDRTIRLTRHIIGAAAMAALCATAAAAQQASSNSSAERSTVSGAYTAAQATRGEALFRNSCGNCHPSSEFSSAGFRAKWGGGSVLTLVEQIRTSMPLDNPGGLSAADYAAVVAYVLRLNGYPAGDAELPTDDAELRRIRFDQNPPRHER